MKTTRTSRLGAAVAATALSTAALLSMGAPAFADAAPGTVTATTEKGKDSYGAGYSNVIDGQSANTFLVKVEGGDVVEVYCVQKGVSFEFDGSVVYNATSFADSKVANAPRAAALASRTIGTPLADKHAETSARQLAIWSYTDNLDYSGVKNAALVARANELKATVIDLPQGITSAVLTAESKLDGSKNTVVASLTSGTGTPIANQTITLTTPAGDQALTTDNAGKASATFEAAKDAGKAKLVWNGVLPAGSVLVPDSGAQKVVTVTDAKISRSVEVDVAAAPEVVAPPVVVTPPAPTPEVTPTPTPEVVAPPAPEAPVAAPPVATPPAEPVAKKELPYTGAPIGASAALGGLGLVGFGLWARRRNANKN